MPIRMNMYGFYLPQMKELLGSKNRGALSRLQATVPSKFTRVREQRMVCSIVERAICEGAPFADLPRETPLHGHVAWEFAADRQQWLATAVNSYYATPLQEDLWMRYRRLARPETKAVLRLFVEGSPMFGSEPAGNGSAYACISHQRLECLRPGFADLHEQVRLLAEQDRGCWDRHRIGAEFVGMFCQSIDEVLDAGRDLFFYYR